MRVFSKARSRALATRVAAVLGGKVKPCRMSFGLMTTARHCVEATYRGMQLEVFVFDPWLEVWVQNVRLTASGEAAFALNEPNRVMGLVERVADAAPAGLAVFRRPWDAAEAPARAFGASADNERDLQALRLGGGESLTVLSHQITARLRAGEDDDARLRARFDALGSIFDRNARPAGKPPLSLEALVVAIGEPGEAGAGPHRFGGTIEDGPECRNCGRPLHQLLSLDTQAPPLDRALKDLPRLPVATCLNCQTLSSPLVLAHEQGRWTIRDQAANQSFDDFPAVLPARPVRLEAPSRGPAGAPAGHRVGGAPEWIQSDETPDCPGCRQPMTFLAQLDTDDRVGVQFGDDGRLYGFVCPRCVNVATLVQST